MTNEQKAKVLMVEIGKMFIATGKEATKETIGVYMEYLRDYSKEHGHTFEEVMEAIKKAGMEIEYTPKVSDIIKLLKPSQDELKAEIEENASWAFSIYKRLIAEGRGEIPSFEDPKIQRAFSLTMERDWENADEFNNYFLLTLRKNLTSIYSLPEFTQRLELKEAEEKQSRGALYE